MHILVTGVAGFIGFNFTKLLLKKNKEVKIIGIDNLNDYYSVALKKSRLKVIKNKIKFFKFDLSNEKKLNDIFKKYNIKIIYHFAAQAGVRYSIENPEKYQKSNIDAFFNIINLSKKFEIKKIIYASSSSVYGDNKKFPLDEKQIISPKNFYGLSKKINEEMAEVYSRYYDIKFIGLRFFTVYGEWGRPDMSIFKIINCSFKKKIFYLNNFGKHDRDFTYVGDVVNTILKLKFNKNKHEVYNICSNRPINLIKLLKIISQKIQLPKIQKRKMQKADVLKTHGNNKKIIKLTKYRNYKDVSYGLDRFIEWYKSYYLN
jgi:UDP-glucuronate 4-epimerase